MRRLRPWLYQGDISDLNVLGHNPEVREKYGITVAVNVGSTPYVPRDLFTIYMPMKDSDLPEDNDRNRVIEVLRLLFNAVHYRGDKIIVTCDAGISRSVAVCGMLISIVERRPMDQALMDEIRHPADPPLEGLWNLGKWFWTWLK